MQRPAVDPHAFNRTVAAFFCHFLVGGVMGPFISPTLVALGYSPTQVGMTIAGYSLCSTLVPVLVGHLSDNYLSLGRTLRICCSLGAFLTLALWTQVQSPVTFIIVLLLLATVRAPLSSLLDTLAMQVAHNTGAVYSRIRLMGSMGFIVSATTAGWWIGGGHEQRFFPTLALLTCVSCASGFFLPDERRTHIRPPERGFWRVLDRPFWIWLVAMMLHWFAFAPYQYGFTLLLQERKVPHEVTGMVWSIGVLAELLAFASCGWVLKRWTTHQVLVIAFCASLLRWLLLGLSPSVPIIIASQLLHGPSFALFYSACMQTLSNLSGGRFRSSYQGLFATTVNGLSACLGTALAGWLHSNMAFSAVILCMLPFEAAALFLLRTTRQDAVELPQGLAASVQK